MGPGTSFAPQMSYQGQTQMDGNHPQSVNSSYGPLPSMNYGETGITSISQQPMPGGPPSLAYASLPPSTMDYSTFNMQSQSFHLLLSCTLPSQIACLLTG